MKHEIFIVDAFADRPYSGNPAAVCLLDHACDEGWMQNVAAEMNLSDTAFLVAQASGEWGLRWFTPKVEVKLCGHATLASAHVLWQELGVDFDSLRFQTRSGWLEARRESGSISLDFPMDQPTPIPTPQVLIDSLGVEPESVSRGREDLLVALPFAKDVHRLEPDLNRLATLNARGVIATALDEGSGYDFVSRFFAPRLGIPEDPVTGSAHCTLGPYWGARLGKSALRGFQASARGGVVAMRLEGERVRLLGQAITILRGQLYV